MSEEKGVGMGLESLGGLYKVVKWFCTIIVRKVCIDEKIGFQF